MTVSHTHAGLHALVAGFAVLATALAGPAVANDAYVTLGAGGLVLSKTEDVAMVREDLDVSVERIKVRYVFRNRSPRDVTATVAFPLPPLTHGDVMNAPIDLKRGEGDPNFVGFTVRVDGKALDPRLHEKAVDEKGRDVSDQVRRFGLSPNFTEPGWPDRVKADLAGARRAGLLIEGGGEGEVEATWRFEPTFSWAQSFPAGKDVVVEHAYRPVAGSGFPSKETFCIDKGTDAAIRRMYGGSEEKVHFASRDVSYVLMSAKTWAGPIGEFHLTLRKDRPDTIISVCLEGLRKTSPTTFELTAKDYVPERDLRVVFVHGPGNGAFKD